MAEYFDAPPRIDFAMDGLCYQLNRSLEAMLQNGRTTFFQGEPIRCHLRSAD
jgi:hypothetical protein